MKSPRAIAAIRKVFRLLKISSKDIEFLGAARAIAAIRTV